MKLDIGCGPKCLPEFIGVDRFPLPGVGIIANLDKPLPFQDNSVELVHAAHSLEHVSDIMFTMREIYRICKHKAQICIVAPYYEQKLNLANPYHLQVFNEHTPRFWTHHPHAPIDDRDFYHPHATPWGLSLSDHSNPGLDIRLLRMEFFYFPHFAKIPSDSLRGIRQTSTDICHQILYHLVVWKDEQNDEYEELAAHLDDYPFLSTPDIEEARRLTHTDESPPYFTQEDSKELDTLAKSHGDAIAHLETLVASQREEITGLIKRESRSHNLIELLSGNINLPPTQKKLFDENMDGTVGAGQSRPLQLSKPLPKDGYLEYPLSEKGAFNSVLLLIFPSALDSEEAEVGVEMVSKEGKIACFVSQTISTQSSSMAIEFNLGTTLLAESISTIRIFSKSLGSPIHIVERTRNSGWLHHKNSVVPYACLFEKC